MPYDLLELEGISDLQKYDFADTSFNLLMQKRIRRVLIICSNYDYFMLEEDGRIDEQIFNEYVSLNLRYPPYFVQTDNETDAFGALREDNIDLVIIMLSHKGRDIFALAKRIKEKYPRIPIVVLTYFTREVSLRLEGEDMSAIDYVFCWLGEASLILAIIKLIEDNMNAEHDIDTGVQAIILVENSIRYISSYLPEIYRIVLMQSLDFQREALNEQQRMLKMRGRPKILLAKNFNDAVDLYRKYKYNVLGVISDISYKRDDVQDENAGFELCEMIMAEDDQVPILLQSSNLKHKKRAEEAGAAFIHKYSRSLSLELRNFIIQYLAFGPFVFRNPETMEPITMATDLQSLQQKLLTIPDNCLEFHASHNHFSKWLNARALFPVAQMFKYIRKEDFASLDEMRRFLYVAISSYRLGKGRGIIAKFDKTSFDEYQIFSRIGEGSIGGKARGLAFINRIIKSQSLFNKFPGVLITIPRTVVLGTDIFDEFMENNNLYHVASSDLSDEEILQKFLAAELPGRVYQDFYAYFAVSKNHPIAVRSSSKLEDSHYQPFAGVYSTYMIPRLEDNKLMVKVLSDAIKEVYASVYYKASKAYMTATSNVLDEEKMGIILQEVCGNRHGNIFYPTFSGVARSINYYPIGSEKAEDGIANVAFGLGKLIVEGGMSLRFCPKIPKKILQLSSPETALRDTQKVFRALDLNIDSFVPSTDDGINIPVIDIKDAGNDKAMKLLASTYDRTNNILRDGTGQSGQRVISFAGVLQHKAFPLSEILVTLLELGQKEMNNPIEIEFAVNLETAPDTPKVFNFLQIRPVVHTDMIRSVDIEKVRSEDCILLSESALGNGAFKGINDVVYVKPDSFNPADTKNIAVIIDNLNTSFVNNGIGYVLIGPGRWGSADPWLGIPVKWVHISAARIIIESGLANYRIDPSQGTHFFQNLTSFGVGYMTLNPYINDGFYDVSYLDNMPAVYEDTFIRHVRFNKPLEIIIDGRKHKGVIIKPS
ncbi:MAG TPA: PEP/pyruvate-binding domain-containing protein [Bacteroidales bacterium]|nr:PEP/pyruvate-binding domain-containing protein [Bacteroidales bacterium]